MRSAQRHSLTQDTPVGDVAAGGRAPSHQGHPPRGVLLSADIEAEHDASAVDERMPPRRQARPDRLSPVDGVPHAHARLLH
jgi:hypothetical protein